MSIYARNTDVSSGRTKEEIEKTLMRYGATGFAYGWQGDKAVIGFSLADRMMRFDLPLPDRASKEFTHTPTGRNRRDMDSQHKEWEQACRQRWRALALVIKAKLEAVHSDITTVEEEFLAHIVMPNGKTFGEWARPQIQQSYKNKRMPPLLGAMTE